MDLFCIQGGRRLQGTVSVEGSKNSALPAMAAAIMVPGQVVLHRIPILQDVATMGQLLQSLGVRVEYLPGQSLLLNATHLTATTAPYELVRRMRAGICVLGPLLARSGTARVSLPGGCNIGHRPIDLHLKGLAALGAEIRIENGYVVASARRLQGAEIDLLGERGPTVTGTCNILTAAVLAKGQTVLRNAAREPEVCDLAAFLNSASAKIEGIGSSTLVIDGVEQLGPTVHSVIPDRIEATTLAIAAAITHGDVHLQHAPIDHMTAVLELLSEIGVKVTREDAGLRIQATSHFRPVRFSAVPYPGVPTDTQAQFMALLSLVPGESRIRDAVFPDRFQHAAELVRLGADIRVEGNSATVRGVRRLSGAPVMASDLRASAALVLAALAAVGQSVIHRVYHLDRGYQAFETKLNTLGASIRRQHDRSPGTMLPAPHFLRPDALPGQNADRSDAFAG
jgi:UDP-N-acetylglucosamine 1-carboxyvinyltransferase